MKVLFDHAIKGLDGTPLTETGDGPITTLTRVCVNSLLAVFPDEPHLSGVEKGKRFQLALRIQSAVSGTETEVSVEEVAMLKTLIGKAYGPLVVGRAYELLEG